MGMADPGTDSRYGGWHPRSPPTERRAACDAAPSAPSPHAPIGEAWALSFSISGEEQGSGATLLVQTGVYQASME